MSASQNRSSTGNKSHRRNPDPTYMVDLEPFREAWERQRTYGLTVGEVARRAGADRELTARRLGAKKPQRKRKVLASGEVVFYEERIARVRYEAGVQLCRALGLDPIDCGV